MNYKAYFQKISLLGFAAFLTTTPTASEARTKLVTLPERAELLVNLQHPSQSLFTETREIPLQEGTNFIDFSWQGVSVDPSSILLTPLTTPDETKVINVKFPPNENALTWEVYTPSAHTETVRVSYLLSGIGRESTYRMIVNEDETEATLQQYFQLQNRSGEEMDDSSIRLNNTEDLTRSIESGETRRFLVTNEDSVPISKLYISKPYITSSGKEDGEPISLVYEIANNTDAELGTYKLPYGKMRIFGKDPSGSTLFLGEDFLQETPVGEDAQVSLGSVKDILFKRYIVSDKQTNVRRNSSNRVILFDREVEIRYEIENFKENEATLRVIESIPPDAEILDLDEDNVTMKRVDQNEVQLDIELEGRPDNAGDEVPKQEITFRYLIPSVVP